MQLMGSINCFYVVNIHGEIQLEPFMASVLTPKWLHNNTNLLLTVAVLPTLAVQNYHECFL